LCRLSTRYNRRVPRLLWFIIFVGIPLEADLVEGRRIYEAQCSYCHGPKGDGGRGANLARAKLRTGSSEEELARVIRSGIDGTEMPRFSLSASQLKSVVVFVRTLAPNRAEAVAGDAGRGKELYAAQRCAGCHTIAGRGGALGPDLDGIGARTGPGYLRAALTAPESAFPPGFQQVRVVTNGGEAVSAVLVNEDSFAIQVRDLGGQYRSYWKGELKEIERQKGRSPMPSYQKLAVKDLDDLVAYMVSLQ